MGMRGGRKHGYDNAVFYLWIPITQVHRLEPTAEFEAITQVYHQSHLLQ